MRVALITIAGGRPAHLERQLAGLARCAASPDHHVIVALDPSERRAISALAPRADVVVMPRPDGPLPLAGARNAGAAAALEHGAELLVFLDVDCIPGADLLGRYRGAAELAGDALLCGPVAYLDPPPAGGYELDALELEPASGRERPTPPDGEIWLSDDHELFWSLSFAATERVWRRLGGFCEDYVGYGAEDTDFGQRAAAAGIRTAWVGGAAAYHQHHPVEDPPVGHLDDILRNAAVFRRAWGWWPMQGWLREFARQGLVRYDTHAARWARREQRAPEPHGGLHAGDLQVD